MRKLFEVKVPTSADITAAAKASRLSFAAQVQKLGKSIEPVTAEQKAAQAKAKAAAQKAKLEAKIAKLRERMPS